MIKKIMIILGSLLLVVGGWFLYDCFHYSPPNMTDKEIKAAALKQLRPQADKMLNLYSQWKEPGMKTEMRSLDILKVGKVRGKTYLVFKMDYRINMTQQAIARMGGQADNMDYYLLGLRLVEKGVTGLKLKPGMEFTSTYLSTGPVDCGRHPDGIFYAYCKDPQVKTLTLESNEGRRYKAVVKNRMVLMAVPLGREELYPRFYGADGREIIPNFNLRVAFVCGDPKAYLPYNSMPVEWWPVKAADTINLQADNLDALWVFPDQLQEMRSPQMVKKVQQLLKGGVQVIFVGWKDPQDIARLLPTSRLEKINQADSIEAVYASTDAQGVIRVGAIGLEDEGSSPLLSKTVKLRYQLNDDINKNPRGAKTSPQKSTVGQGSGSGSGNIVNGPAPTVKYQKSIQVQGKGQVVTP